MPNFDTYPYNTNIDTLCFFFQSFSANGELLFWVGGLDSYLRVSLESQTTNPNQQFIITLPKTSIAPENRPSQKETHLPTIHFQVLWFSFREGSWSWLSFKPFFLETVCGAGSPELHWILDRGATADHPDGSEVVLGGLGGLGELRILEIYGKS